MKILFVGDVHGQFKEFEKLVNGSDADIAVQCGDFGIWTDCLPGLSLPEKYRLKLEKPVYFVEGNHDNHMYLESRMPTNPKGVEITHNLTWMPRGSRKVIGGKKFLFCGGADSIDKEQRLAYYPGTWWPGEVIDESVLKYVQNGEHFDFVVAHDRPEFVSRRIKPNARLVGNSSTVLSNLYGKISVDNWVSGHWHEYSVATVFETKFTTLNMLPMEGILGYGQYCVEIEV